jgi:putative transposase
VEKPEDYRWCSLGYRIQYGNRDGFLAFSGLFEFEDHRKDEQELLRLYRSFVYQVGGEIEKPGKATINENLLKFEKERNFELPRSEVLLYRWRYFSDGLVLGSKSFIQTAYARFSGVVFYKKERKEHATGIAKGDLLPAEVKLLEMLRY